MATPTAAPLPTSGPGSDPGALDDGRSGRLLSADIIIGNAPDPVCVYEY
jgi:hypothetical protein